jgi:hypothetical protein
MVGINRIIIAVYRRIVFVLIEMEIPSPAHIASSFALNI